MEITEFFAKFWGLYLVVMALLMVIRKEQIINLFNAIIEDERLTQIAGFIALFSGFATVILHNQWSMSWEVIITIIGWWAMIEGILLMGWPKLVTKLVKGLVEKLYWPGFVFAFVLGIYLFYMAEVFEFLM